MSDDPKYNDALFWAEKLWMQLRRLGAWSFRSRFQRDDGGQLLQVASSHAESVRAHIERLRQAGVSWHCLARFCWIVESGVAEALYCDTPAFGDELEPADDAGDNLRGWTTEERDVLMRVLFPVEGRD